MVFTRKSTALTPKTSSFHSDSLSHQLLVNFLMIAQERFGCECVYAGCRHNIYLSVYRPHQSHFALHVTESVINCKHNIKSDSTAAPSKIFASKIIFANTSSFNASSNTQTKPLAVHSILKSFI